MQLKINKTKFFDSRLSLIKAGLISLVLVLSSITAKAENTIVFNGTTYNNVSLVVLDNPTYTTFYDLVSIQPWFRSNVLCFDGGDCASTLALFTSITSPGAAVTHAPLPIDSVAGETNADYVENYNGSPGISGTIYDMFDLFGGIFCFINCPDSSNIGPTAADTLASMQPNASGLKNAFNSQYATLAYGLNHDCTVFDTNGVCVSVFGRNTSLNDSANDNNAAGLVLGYKPHAQFRVGTYIDQSLNSNTTAGVKVERSNPDVGVFGVWNMNADGSGLELRAAANYGKRDLNVTRSVVGDSSAEAGSGRSDLNAYGALFEASFAYGLNDNWTAKPYAGVRYLSIKRDGYSEGTTGTVESPLSYSGLKQQTTSALVGVRFNGRLAPKLMASFNAGFEHDLNHSINDYRATGVDDLGSINMNSQKDRTRPTAGLGISYDVAEKQRLSANVQYRKEIFMSESSTTGQINYTIGF